MISPFAISQPKENLNEVNYVTIYTDFSNHKSTKIFPLLVCYFLPMDGVQVKVLELEDKCGETSDIVSSYILKTLSDHNIENKIVGLCADNTNYNFGGAARRGKIMYTISLKIL